MAHWKSRFIICLYDNKKRGIRKGLVGEPKSADIPWGGRWGQTWKLETNCQSRRNKYNVGMALPYRLQGKNCFYHVMSRGDDRKKVYTIPSDYGKFMDYVTRAKEW